MRVAVYGLWHLGCVTAACLAEAGNQVVGLDLDAAVVDDLRRGVPPLHEPGLAELIAAEQHAGRLSFTTDAANALCDADVLWVAFDTPVNDADEADVAFVRDRLEHIADAIRPGTLVLITSQVPVGFTRALADDWQDRGLGYAYSPENLRLGKAIACFRQAERVIVGCANGPERDHLARLFGAFTSRIEWMSIESAEMTKHALNAFLATSVTFINELARLCEAVGADAKEVERGLKSEARIGQKAYLAPGPAFAGGTLARDITFLRAFGRHHQLDTPLFDGVAASNQRHKDWSFTKVCRLVDGSPHARVAVLGLTYKPGTNTLRRSSAVELCLRLHQRGLTVRAHDPLIRSLPDELRSAVCLCESAAEALVGADVAVLATEWPDYRALQAQEIVRLMRSPCFVDQAHFLADTLGADARLSYCAPGCAATAGTGLRAAS